MPATGGFVEGTPDWEKGVGERLAWWLHVAFSAGPLGGVWRTMLIYASLLRILPRPMRGRVIEVSPRGTTRTLAIRVGTSDLKILEDIYLREEYRWPFAHDPKVLVDAGAYTGLSTVYFATRYPSATIIAVEPSHDNYELLARNTEGLANVHLVHAALWNERGTLDMVDPGYGPFAYRVGRSDATTANDAGREHVDALAVPDIVETYSLERIDLLKVDIEGSEVEVFTDASGWIDRVDALCLELHDRLRPGCSRAFFGAVGDFEVEQWRGESVLMTRRASQLGLQG